MEKCKQTFLLTAAEVADSIVRKIEKMFEYIHLNEIDEDDYAFYFMNANEGVVRAFYQSLSYSYNGGNCAYDLSEIDTDLILGTFTPVEMERWANICEITLYKKDAEGIPVFTDPITIPV